MHCLDFPVSGVSCLPTAEMICSFMKISVRTNDPARDGSYVFENATLPVGNAKPVVPAGREGRS